MKLIIDIPEEIMEFIKNNGCLSVIYNDEVAKAIINGTPLPKGHGRLIDTDESIQDIIDDSQLCIFNSECERIVHEKMVEFAIDRIASASTIIEADKGEEQ